MKRTTEVCAALLLVLFMAGCGGRRWGGDAQTPGPAAVEGTIAPVQTQEPRTPEPTEQPPESSEEAQATPGQTPTPETEEANQDAAAQQETAEALDDILSGMDDVKAAASGLDEVEEGGVAIPTP